MLKITTISWKVASISALALGFLTACGAPSEPTEIRAEGRAIQSHLEFLASDLLEGRDTGTQSHEIASAYIAAQFQRMGVAPAGTDGYYQRVPLRTARVIPDSQKFTIHNESGESRSLVYPRDFLMGPSVFETESSVTAPLVFVGYGMVSDQFEIDDYANLDVSGAIVVTLSGLPEGLPSEEAAHLNSIKTELAVERGAVGMISIHTPKREETVPYERAIFYANSPRVRWIGENGVPQNAYPEMKGGATINYEAAEALFANVPVTGEEIYAQMAAGERPVGMPLDLSVTLEKSSTYEDMDSPNVIGMIEGSDPALKDEYIIYTAHSDHIGPVRSVEGPAEFNNGAMDNASGVSVMLETARMFADLVASGERPKRSILFAAVTAEERGLLGADYFAHNPTVPIENIVANVNLDMPVLLYDFADVVAFGANHSTLADAVAIAAGKFGIESAPDPMPEQALFTRSDHYTLVKQGVPAVFLMTGFTSKNPDENAGEIWQRFLREQYHRPTDEVSTLSQVYGGIRYGAAATFADINFEIGKTIANDTARPEWNEDSYFGRVFAGGENSIRH
ncbi:MAG: family M28 peptidase [Idiomarinaceae bacterium HL-53]|nr:MAG: family M28 peptidase [Idiomarinaceae bacterium HL-53]CUS49413.1 PA domain-containing protein [Idiomarinaceae bacterium HL-53]